jgi:hypothetical protein
LSTLLSVIWLSHFLLIDILLFDDLYLFMSLFS